VQASAVLLHSESSTREGKMWPAARENFSQAQCVIYPLGASSSIAFDQARFDCTLSTCQGE
jgi:hypothetical protein